MLIKVKAFPGSKRQEVVKKAEDSFEVRVKQKPVMGLANKEARAMLASYFGIPELKVRLITGFKKRNKVFEVNIPHIR